MPTSVPSVRSSCLELTVDDRATSAARFVEGDMVVRITVQKKVAFKKADLPFDLYKFLGGAPADENKFVNAAKDQIAVKVLCRAELPGRDRKSTRLNSSH